MVHTLSTILPLQLMPLLVAPGATTKHSPLGLVSPAKAALSPPSPRPTGCGGRLAQGGSGQGLRGPAAKHALSHTQPLESDSDTREGAVTEMKNRWGELEKEEARLRQLEEQLQEAIEVYAGVEVDRRTWGSGRGLGDSG
eukprot:SAG31_NODE_93_length_26250_cov_47.615082_2_plen_140_part_00